MQNLHSSAENQINHNTEVLINPVEKKNIRKYYTYYYT